MSRLANISAFVAVIEHGSFAEAARQMGLSRSQVNKSVIALEERLGTQLLMRTTRKVSPSASGDAFYARAKQILADLADAERAVMEDRDEPRGTLRLNAPMSFGALHLGPAIADFMALYPDLRVELSLNDRFVDVIEEGFDATLRIGELDENSALVDHPICMARRFCVAAPAFLDRHGPLNNPDQLKTLPCLHYGTFGRGHSWRLVGPDRTHTVAVNAVMQANNGEVLAAACERGLGIAMLPTFITGPALQDGRLVRVLPDYAPPDIHLMLVYPPNRHLAPKIRRLIDFLYDRFGSRPHWDLLE
ncbi:MAG: LysR family transcriptional regulator [Alphaproteobacteria bacterium]|nr:MAG: LysR family transcriptional regulator [Alphaproteobacteria bacterium]